MITNLDDITSQLREADLLIDEALLADTTKPVRVKTLESKGRDKPGWYWLHTITINSELYYVGTCGINKGNDHGTIKLKLNRDGKAVKIDAAEKAAIAARQKADRERMQALRAAEARKAAAKAAHVWRNYQAQPTEGKESAYLKRKNVRAFGLRFSPGSQTIAVPMMDAAGGIHGLQLIRGSDRRTGQLEKEYFPKGLAKTGHFHILGGSLGAVGQIVLIAEGYATAATLHQATGHPVVVAFDAGNLQPVAQAIATAYKRTRPRILICADDDYLTGHPGMKAAQLAAMAVEGSAIIPTFAQDRAGQKITDFNDLAEREGEPVVRAQIEAHLLALGWNGPATVAGSTSQGSGAAAQGGGAHAHGIAPADDSAPGRRRACSVMQLDDIVARFIPLDDGTGKYVFDTWTNKIAHRDQMMALMPAGARGDDIKRHPTWINRGAYYLDQVGFDPTEKDADVALNTWKGWPMEAKAGNCERLIELLEYLCKDAFILDRDGHATSATVAHWLLCWMAYPLQNPGAKMSSAVIMHGPQGTGKSTIFQTLAKIYGDHATVLNQRGLEDKFNSDWSDSKLFILAEEVVTRQEMWHIKNELKELVTGEWIRINPKNIAAYRQRNQLNIAYLSNENQPLPIENDDRRHLVIYTPPALDESYYDEVFIELEQGGAAAFYDYLLNLDLTGFHPKKKPPMTEAKAALMNLASPSEQRFVLDWVSGEAGLPICPAKTMDVFAAYLRWCRLNSEPRPRPSNQFLGSLARMSGWSKHKVKAWDNYSYTGEAQPVTVISPPQNVLEAAKRAHKPGESIQVWHTDGILDFAAAIKSTRFEQREAA